MSTYKRLQLDNNNLQEEENSKLVLQDKYLKYKYKYLKQKEIIQTEQIYKASLNLDGGAGVIDYITNNPGTALATTAATCYGLYCYFGNKNSNSSNSSNSGNHKSSSSGGHKNIRAKSPGKTTNLNNNNPEKTTSDNPEKTTSDNPKNVSFSVKTTSGNEPSILRQLTNIASRGRFIELAIYIVNKIIEKPNIKIDTLIEFNEFAELIYLDYNNRDIDDTTKFFDNNDTKDTLDKYDQYVFDGEVYLSSKELITKSKELLTNLKKIELKKIADDATLKENKFEQLTFIEKKAESLQELVWKKMDELGSIETGTSNPTYKSISIIIKTDDPEVTKMEKECNIILYSLFPKIIKKNDDIKLIAIDHKNYFFNKIILQEYILNELNKLNILNKYNWKQIYLAKLKNRFNR